MALLPNTYDPIAYYDARFVNGEAAAAPANGAAVATWTDLSGNGRHLTQTTTARRPAYRSAHAPMGGRPAIQFDGVDDMMQVSGFPLSTQVTAYAVFNSTPNRAADSVIMGRVHVNDVRQTPYHRWRFSILADDSPSWRRNDTRLEGAILSDANVSARQVVTFKTYPFLGYRNGTQIINSTDGDVTYPNGDTMFRIGANAEQAELLAGSIERIVVYDGTHDETTRAAIEAYLLNPLDPIESVLGVDVAADVSFGGSLIPFKTSTLSATAVPTLAVDGTISPLKSGVVPLAASVDNLAIAGSLTKAGVVGLAAAVDNLTVGAVREQLLGLSMAASSAAAVAGVREQLSVLPVRGTPILVVRATPVGGIDLDALSAALFVDLSELIALLAPSAPAGATFGGLRTQPAVLAVRGTPAAILGPLRTQPATLVARGTPVLAVRPSLNDVLVVRGIPALALATVQGYFRTLTMRAVPALDVPPFIIGVIVTHRPVKSLVVDDGRRAAVLLANPQIARLLDNGRRAAVIRRGI